MKDFHINRYNMDLTFFSKEIQLLVPELKIIGEEVLNIYNSNFSHELKNDNSPLTKADLLSEKLLMNFFNREFPGYGIISEETPNKIDVYEKNKIWVIDPIDGTKDFIKKTGEFSIMIALIDNTRRPIIGIVYAPVLDKLYVAEKNKGSYLIENDNIFKINVNYENDISKFKLIKSRYHFSELDEKISNSLNITSFVGMGSVGIKFGEIAEGKAQLCYYTTNNMGIWDDCASDIILTEAGGEVFDIYGNEPVYNLKSRKMESGFIGTCGTNKKMILSSIKNLLSK